jgi:DNA-binding NarL/FixJ family response regulator
MYAWLEGQGDIEGEWVKVGEVSDIATRTIYGYTKLGTDLTIEDGAPVGKDANGRMAVGAATEAVPGTGKLSAGYTIIGGAAIGLDANNAYRVVSASYHTAGAMSYSYSGTADVACVGKMADGSAGITWASHERGGAVIIADGINDSRSYAVLSTEYLKAYLASNYLGKTDSWTREQIIQHVKEALSGYYSKTESLDAQGVHDAINESLLNYYDKTAVEGQIKAIAGQIADAKLADYYNTSESDARYVQTGKGGVMKLHAMYKSEFDQLATREANAVYFVKRNKS